MPDWTNPEADIKAAIGKVMDAYRGGRPPSPVVVVPRWISELDGYAESAARLSAQLGVTFRVAEGT